MYKTNNIKTIKLIDENTLKIILYNNKYTHIVCWEDDDDGKKCGYNIFYDADESAKPAESTKPATPATAMYKQSTVL